ncbi:MAG TPA: tryptophan halogenase family protein [Rhizomicrobium sp.]|jgi:tryptophan halogenase|nr:tryptophan halogenase family protein [Rhizomicrobium sp.]
MNTMAEDGALKAAGRRIRKIVIVGGGSAGWMAAAALRNAMRREPCQIVLVESDEIGIVGVGESTLPGLREFNRILGIDENEFVSKTQATFKLAIEFVDWKRIGHSYFNPVASQGLNSEDGSNIKIPFVYQALLKLAVEGDQPDMDQYALCTMAARQNRFDRPKNVPEGAFDYAFQFDAARYAKYLRSYAEARGVERVEGKIVDVPLRGDNGFIDAVVLQSGQRIEGDLFIDCSGFRALLIGQALKVPCEDWSHWLPCDRAWAVPCESTGSLAPYTRATAREAGWQWRIPLQHRVGNGYVFSSRFTSEESARELLLSNLEGPPLGEPRLVKFTAGRRNAAWTKNCVSVGLSQGFVEPLESTSIHFIQSSVLKLIKNFPERDCGPLVSDEYNRLVATAFDRVRDFIIVHFKATEREDTEFWRYCKYMSVPDSLAVTMEMFRKHGRLPIRPGEEGFGPRPWATVLYSQGITPESYPPLIMQHDDRTIRTGLAKIRSNVQRTVENMPRHEDFIARNCSAAMVPA